MIHLTPTLLQNIGKPRVKVTIGDTCKKTLVKRDIIIIGVDISLYSENKLHEKLFY